MVSKDGGNLEFYDNFTKLIANLDKNGIKYEKAKTREVETRYVDPGRRSSILQDFERKLGQQQSGSDLHNLLKEAINRHNEPDQKVGKFQSFLFWIWVSKTIFA